MKTVYAISALAALGIGTAAVAQEATTFDFFADTQTSEEIAYTDFNAALDESGMYDEWDADQDEALTRDEFNRGVWSRYDANQDDVLDADERGRAADEDFFGLGD